MAKVKLSAANGDKPTKRADIDKVYIVEYTKINGTPEQRKAIKEAIQKHTVERVSQLTKKKYKDVELKAVRDLFCDLFFPELNVKAGKKGFFDLVNEL